jgi:hypothetical protein
MKNILINTVRASAFGVVATMAPMAYAQDQDPFADEDQEVLELDVEDPADEFEESETVDLLTGSLHEDLEQALAELDESELELAAEYIDNASFMIASTAEEAEGSEKTVLSRESEGLSALSKKVAAGKVKDAKVMKASFAKAHHVLANFYSTAAKSAEETEQGNLLLGAVYHTEHAASMAGYKMASSEVASLKAAKVMAAELYGGGEVSKDTSAASFKTLAKASQSIGTHLKASGKARKS